MNVVHVVKDSIEREVKPTKMDRELEGQLRMQKLIGMLHKEASINCKGDLEKLDVQQRFMEENIENVIASIKEFDPWFEIEERVNTGSYYDGTKILEADEFDYMGILKNSPMFTVVEGCKPGLAHVKINNHSLLSHVKSLPCPNADFDFKGSELKSAPYAEGYQSYSDAEYTVPVLSEKGYLSAKFMHRYFNSMSKRSMMLKHNKFKKLGIPPWKGDGKNPVVDKVFGPGAMYDKRVQYVSRPGASGPNVETMITGPLCPASVDITLAITIDPIKINKERYGHLKHSEDASVVIARPTGERGEFPCPSCWTMSFGKAEKRKIRNMAVQHKQIHMILKYLATEKMVGIANNSYVIKTLISDHLRECQLNGTEYAPKCFLDILEVIRNLVTLKLDHLDGEDPTDRTKPDDILAVSLMMGVSKAYFLDKENMPGYKERDIELYQRLLEMCLDLIKSIGLKGSDLVEKAQNKEPEDRILHMLRKDPTQRGMHELKSILARCPDPILIYGAYHNWIVKEPSLPSMHIAEINVLGKKTYRAQVTIEEDNFDTSSDEDEDDSDNSGDDDEEEFDKGSIDSWDIPMRSYFELGLDDCFSLIEEFYTHREKLDALIAFFEKLASTKGKRLFRKLTEDPEVELEMSRSVMQYLLENEFSRFSRWEYHEGNKRQPLFPKYKESLRRFIDNLKSRSK
ncbi:unnamed protein product [Owenia fusiformis]|uniref:Uncharacterized protein n=1 Tax=Owenia fusiformis TaxID=6347 RepID=A0A8J1TTC2_OWEFU|nr:unnamed protein product [Owenia fusiformis]